METESISGGTILVVDDSPTSLKMMFNQLNLSGFSVYVAESGEAALELANRVAVDLILLDVMMPGMDGFETCYRLKSRPDTKDIPVIFMTALSDTPDKIRGLEAGAVDYVVKPIHPQEVVARINTHLTIQRLQAKLQAKNKQLQTQIAETLKAKQALQQAHDELEQRVQERTAALSDANARLKKEIIEHRWTEKALRESEGRFRQFITSISDHIYVSRFTPDKKWSNLYISPNVETLSGYPRQNFVENWYFWSKKVIHPEDRPHAYQQIPRLMQGKNSEVEYRIVRADGSIIFVRDSARVEMREHHLVVYGVVSDISANKRLQNQLLVIHQTGRELTLLRDETAILQRLFETVPQVLSFEQASYALIDEVSGDVQYWNSTPAGWEVHAVPAEEAEQNIGLKAIETGQAILIHDIDQEPAYAAYVNTSPGRSQLCVPMRVRGRVVGYLNFGSSQPNSFSESNQLLLQTLADQTAVALENAHLYAETQLRAAELRALVKAGRTMTSTLDLKTVLESAMDIARTILTAEGVAILLYDHRQEALVFAAAASPGSDQMLKRAVPLDSSIAGWCFREKKAVRVTDAANDPRFYSRIDAMTGLMTQSILAVPLMHKQKVVGVLEATNKLTGVFTDHDLEMLEALAHAAAIAIVNAQFFEQIQTGREQLRHLAHQVVSAQEEERQRLSYELHDEAGQTLTALKLWLELTQGDLSPECQHMARSIEEAIDLTVSLTNELRSIARNLHPPALDVAGLRDVLEDHCDEFAKRSGLVIDFQGTSVETLSQPAKICLYRFLQESLTNVARHAHASRVTVALQTDEHSVKLSVTDDGLGFNKDNDQAKTDRPKGLGLLGMQERLDLLGGRLEIDSQPGQGTCITAHLPLEAKEL